MRDTPLHRVARTVRAVLRAETPVHEDLRERISGVVAVTLLIDVVASVAVYFLERHAPESKIITFGDSVFWVTAQLLTVSSQFPNPITAGAKVIDILLELYAIVVVTSVAGIFASFFHGRSRQKRLGM